MELQKVLGKVLDTGPIKNLLRQGEANVDRIYIPIAKNYDGLDISEFAFELRAESEKDTLATQVLEKSVGVDEIRLLWVATSAFTAVAGSLNIVIVGLNTSGVGIIKITGEKIIVGDTAGVKYLPAPNIVTEAINQVTLMVNRAVSAAVSAEKSAATAAANATNASNSAKGAATSSANAKKSEENAKKSETGAEGSLTDINTGLASCLPISEANQLFKSVVIDETTGIFTFTRYDGTQLIIDTGLEKVVVNFRLDPDTLELILILADGTEQRVSLVPFLNLYTGGSTTTVDISVSGTIITASIKGNSISFNLLTPDLQAIINNKITANSAGNANQVKFADGKTMQQKIDAGDLNGKDGIAIEQSGLFYMRVDEFGHLKVGVPDNVEPPPLSIRNGRLIYTIS